MHFLNAMLFCRYYDLPEKLNLNKLVVLGSPVSKIYKYITTSASYFSTNNNTSLAAQGALAHRLQRRPRPIHKNAKSGAHPCSLPLSFNMAGWDLGGGGGKKKKKKS